MLKAFLERCPPDRKKALLHFLPEKQRNFLQHTPHISEQISPDAFTLDAILSKVHWSWFLPALKTYSEKEQELFLSTLDPFSAKNLAKTLDILFDKEKLSPLVTDYLHQVLLGSIANQNDLPLPSTYLPVTPLKPLLSLSKKELVRLIDLLSLYDLAEEQRLIVETKILKRIYSLLTEEEKKLLKKASAQKEAYTLGRIGLERWDGSEESLRSLLHRKGLARLAAALSGEGSDFLWHICHQLDIGRGSVLFKLASKESPSHLRETITRQIVELL